MSVNDTIALILGVVALICYLVLMAMRIYDDKGGSRVLFLDFLLVIAALEVVADISSFKELATLCQGGLLAGGIALLVTYNRQLWKIFPRNKGDRGG